MFDFSINATLGDFTLCAQVSSQARVIGIIGASGQGKTSLLGAVAGLVNVADTRIVVGEQTLVDTATDLFVPAKQRKIGYVFQDALLFPHLTVRGNLRYGAGAHGHPPEEKVVVDVLELGQLLNRMPGELSGGEARRVAIGRALLSGPRILLLDEPVTGLDRRLANKTLLLLRRVLDTFQIPTLYVSHAISDIIFLCEEAWHMNHGRITSVALPRLMLATLAGDDGVPWANLTNVFTGHLTDHSSPTTVRVGNIDLITNIPKPPSEQTAILTVSASDIILARHKPTEISARNILPGIIQDITTHEQAAVVVVDAGERWMVRLTRAAIEDLHLAPGDSVFLILKASSIHVTT